MIIKTRAILKPPNKEGAVPISRGFGYEKNKSQWAERNQGPQGIFGCETDGNTRS
jgi:hypothetical protein